MTEKSNLVVPAAKRLRELDPAGERAADIVPVPSREHGGDGEGLLQAELDERAGVGTDGGERSKAPIMAFAHEPQLQEHARRGCRQPHRSGLPGGQREASLKGHAHIAEIGGATHAFDEQASVTEAHALELVAFGETLERVDACRFEKPVHDDAVLDADRQERLGDELVQDVEQGLGGVARLEHDGLRRVEGEGTDEDGKTPQNEALALG
jgi:hypothetical protein